VGDANPDILVVDADPVPMFGEVERTVARTLMTVGGSSAICACGLARLGLNVAFFGTVGDDAFGEFMLRSLEARGIDVAACVVDPSRPTGSSVILTDGQDRAILTAAGTIGSLNLAAVPDSLVGRSRHVHLGAMFLQQSRDDAIPAFFASMRRRGITTSFDTNWDPTGHWAGGVIEMLRCCDIFFPNEGEAKRIARSADAVEAAQVLAALGSVGRDDGGPVIVVKLGKAGALAVQGGGPVVRVSALDVDPVDATGAGDSFDAGFLRAWLDGAPLPDCLALGAACGGLSTRSAGGVDGQPTFDEARRAADEVLARTAAES
jgi:sugar/nucleoside kinase (ribokinase family)